MKPIRIALIDDDALILTGIKFLFESEPEIEIIEDYTNPEFFLEEYTNNIFQILVIDIQMPVLNGIALSKKILEVNPKQKIILLTTAEDIETINKAFDMEIAGYVLKSRNIEELKKAIKKVHLNKMYCSDVIMDKLYRFKDLSIKKEKQTENIHLTKKEKLLIGFIKDGITSKEICSKANISIQTYYTHIKNISKKTNTKGLGSLVKFYYDHVELFQEKTI